MDRKLGVAVCGVGWCGSQHTAAFQRNPHVEITWLYTRDAGRARAALSKYGIAVPGARITTRYDEVLAASDVDIIAIATPNHLHAEQTVATAQTGRHLVLEKPTALDVAELVRIRDAVRQSGVRTIVSFVLRFNPFLKFVRWLRVEGWLGDIRFARTQYLSRVTDRYSGWEWVRTRESGRSHLLLQWLDTPLDLAALSAANPFPDVQLAMTTDARGRPAIRIACSMPDSGDVAHHPFQPEIDELVACILEGRETSTSVFDAQKTMEVCLAADRSAELGGTPVALPLISS